MTAPAPAPTVSKTGCTIHKDHRPQIDDPGGFVTDEHHIQPMGEGGADVAANRIRVCPTGHRRIHRIMQVLHKYDGTLPTGWSRKFHPEEMRLARKGYEAAMVWRRRAGVPMEAEFCHERLPAATFLQEDPEPPRQPPQGVGMAQAQQVMIRAYTTALDEHEARVQVWDSIARIINAMRVFWNTVIAFLIVDVLLDVIPLINAALDSDQTPDWGKLQKVALRTLLGGILGYLIKFRGVKNDSDAPPPPPPPVPDQPVPTPAPEPAPAPEPEEPGEDPNGGH